VTVIFISFEDLVRSNWNH